MNNLRTGNKVKTVIGVGEITNMQMVGTTRRYFIIHDNGVTGWYFPQFILEVIK